MDLYHWPRSGCRHRCDGGSVSTKKPDGELRTSSATLSTRGPLPKTAIGVRLKPGWQGGRSGSTFRPITPWSSKTIGPLTKSLFGRLRGTQTQIASGDGSPPNPFRGTGAGAYGNCREGYGLKAYSFFAAAPKHGFGSSEIGREGECVSGRDLFGSQPHTPSDRRLF
jgi:hypothetical protein